MPLRIWPSLHDLHAGLKQLDHQSIVAYDSTMSSSMSRLASVKVGVYRSDDEKFCC